MARRERMNLYLMRSSRDRKPRPRWCRVWIHRLPTPERVLGRWVRRLSMRFRTPSADEMGVLCLVIRSEIGGGCFVGDLGEESLGIFL